MFLLLSNSVGNHYHHNTSTFNSYINRWYRSISFECTNSSLLSNLHEFVVIISSEKKSGFAICSHFLNWTWIDKDNFDRKLGHLNATHSFECVSSEVHLKIEQHIECIWIDSATFQKHHILHIVMFRYSKC